MHGKNVVHMTRGDDELHFFYDAQNKPAVVVYNGTAYSYVKNLQGDVVAILDQSGNVVVQYKYDAWGRPISKTGSLAGTLGTVQPYRYRGYVYDEETGFYYLRSRYMYPSLSRFLNTDTLLSAGCSAIHSIYAYCSNEPVYHIDNDGMAGRSLKPTTNDGYISPNKNGEPQWSAEGNGWIDIHGNVWVPQTGARAHGGEHWDVQTAGNNRGYTNVYPGGKTNGGRAPYPNLPELYDMQPEAPLPQPESYPYPDPMPTPGPMTTMPPLPTPAPNPIPPVVHGTLPPLATAAPRNPVIEMRGDVTGTLLVGGIVFSIWGLTKILAAPATGGLSLVLP